MQWISSSSVYPVADVAASIAWYRCVFEFEPRIVNPPGDEVPVYAVLQRGGVSIHLLRSDEAPYGLTSPVQTQFRVDGALDDLFRRVEAMGVIVIQSPRDRPWGHRDFMVADPDRNIVWVTVPLPHEDG